MEGVLNRARVPEHSVGLMTRLSGGEPFLEGDFFGCVRKDWVILVGYALEGWDDPARLSRAMAGVVDRFGPRRLSLIGPRLPADLPGKVLEQGRDAYYSLDLPGYQTPGRLRREVRKAGERLEVSRSRVMGEDHQDLAREFLDRARPPERVANLYGKLPAWMENSETALVLEAWDRAGGLSAFYVLDLAPAGFTSYLAGAHSKVNYCSHASDLLMQETIDLSRERGKTAINLGLGVNPGVARFKRKWGGRPTLDYEMVELDLERPGRFRTALGFLKQRAG